MPFKFTMLFNFKASGWSESWYYNGTPSFPVAANSVFDQLFGVRAELCGNHIEPLGWRLSDVDNPRQTYTRTSGKINDSGLLPDTPSSAWLAIVRGVGLVGKRQLWLRSIPDAWVAWDIVAEKFVPTGPLITAKNGYENLLKTPPWCIRTVQSFKASTTKVRVTAIAPAVSGGTDLSVNIAGLDPFKPIIVSGFRKPLGVLNGTYDAYSGFVASTGNINLPHVAIPSSQATAYPGGGYVRQQVFAYTNVSSVELQYPRKRKVGRAFFADHGRRSSR